MPHARVTHCLLALSLLSPAAVSQVPIVDVDFDDVTPPADVDLIVVRERFYGAVGVDLTAYGIPGVHDFVQSIYVRTRHGVNQTRREVQGRLLFSAGITVLGVIYDGGDLGGSVDDGVATETDLLFGIPGVSPDLYSSVARGSESFGEAEHVCLRPNGTVDFNHLMRHDDVDDFRVIIDYGTAWTPDQTMDVELTVDAVIPGAIAHEQGVRIGIASVMAPGSGDMGEVAGMSGIPLNAMAPGAPNGGNVFDPLAGILLNRVGGPLSANHLELYDPARRVFFTHMRQGIRSALTRGPHGYVYGNAVNFSGFSVIDLLTGSQGYVRVPNLEGPPTVVGGRESGHELVIAGHLSGVNTAVKVNLVDVRTATATAVVTIPVTTLVNPVGVVWNGSEAYVLDSLGVLATVDFAAGTFTAVQIPQSGPGSYMGLEVDATETRLFALRQAGGSGITSLDEIDVNSGAILTDAIVVPQFIRPRALTRDGGGHLWISRSTFGLPVAGPMAEIDPSTWTLVEIHECASKWDPNAILAGVNPAPLGTSYCTPANPMVGITAVPNTTGRPGSVIAFGSASVADNAFFLRAIDLPTGSLSMFLNSTATGVVAPAPGSSGNVCLSPTGIGRYQILAGLTSSGPNGSFSLQVDLTDVPRPMGNVAVMPGETWYFQCWHRQNPSTTNFTDAIAVTFTA